MYKNKDIAIARELELAEVLLDFIVVAAKFEQKVNLLPKTNGRLFERR